MKGVRCCECGWLCPVTLECSAPSPACLDDPQWRRYLTATFCMEVRSCDSFEPLPGKDEKVN